MWEARPRRTQESATSRNGLFSQTFLDLPEDITKSSALVHDPDHDRNGSLRFLAGNRARCISFRIVIVEHRASPASPFSTDPLHSVTTLPFREKYGLGLLETD